MKKKKNINKMDGVVYNMECYMKMKKLNKELYKKNFQLLTLVLILQYVKLILIKKQIKQKII